MQAMTCRVFLAASLVAFAVVGCRSEYDDARFAPTTERRIDLDSVRLRESGELAKLLDSAERRRPFPAKDSALLEVIRELNLADAQSFLARLGYLVTVSGSLDTRTKQGVAAFERRHGLQITSSPFSATFLAAKSQVSSDLAWANSERPPGFLLALGGWPNSAWTEGVWWPMMWQQEFADISCIRSQGRCTETHVRASGGQWSLTTTDYVLQRWDESSLVAVNRALCFESELRIGHQDSTVTRIDRDIGAAKDCAAGPDGPRFFGWSGQGPRLYRLRDGRAVRDSLTSATLRKYQVLPAHLSRHLDSLESDSKATKR